MRSVRNLKRGRPAADIGRVVTVTARFTERNNYLMGLASRASYRTKSAFIEWAVSCALEKVMLRGRVPLSEAANVFWREDADDRLQVLNEHYPELLTPKERVRVRMLNGEDNADV
jgi:hypothetical protein